jgi:uncharacterized membrane protein
MSEQAFLWATTAVMLAVIGGTMALTPAISDATVPLGVRVPSSRIHTPVVRDAVRRFRLWCAGLTIVALAVTIPWHTVGALLVLAIGLIAACTGAWIGTRRAITAAKQSQHWYRDVPVRLSAPIGRDTGAVRPIWGLHAPAILLGGAAPAVAAARYPLLPDPYPTHWNAMGQADAWSARSWGTVLALPLVAVALAAILAIVAFLVSRGRAAVQPHRGDWKLSADQQHRIAALVQQILGAVNLLTALMLAGMSLVPVLGWGAVVQNLLTWGGIALLVVVIAASYVLAARIRREPVRAAQRRPRRRVEEEAARATDGTETPDDDHLWWGGLLYINRDDPSFFVPRRAGVGYDINLGNPWGLGLMAVLLLVLLGLTVGILVAGI